MKDKMLHIGIASYCDIIKYNKDRRRKVGI